jgi:hypothetical protein
MKLHKIPVGARIRDKSTGVSFYVAAQNHPGYEGTTLLSEYVVRVGCFDAAEPTNPGKVTFKDSRTYGNNKFPASNLCQWLNSEGTDWYTPQHQYDAPPTPENTRHQAGYYADAPGYLSELPETLKKAILISQVPILKPVPKSKPVIETFETKVFLPSRTELGLGGDWGVDEGSMLPLFRDFRAKQAPLSQHAFDTYTSPWHSFFTGAGNPCRWWLRTSHTQYSYLVRYVAEFGGLSYAPAFTDIVGIRPMMNVSGDLEVSDTGECGNIYYIKEEQK